MAEKSTLPLPLPPEEYDMADQSFTRRTIEQSLQDLNQEVGNLKRLHESGVSRAIKRHQFLLMGMKHG